ncbi:MAG: AAA family ATPase, partial [Hyphomicrobiales bacterium]|nr:AAA family ATPase [Hyphomicrobiales bacterium]
MTSQAPLAERLRPTSLDEVVGQSQLLGPDGALSRLVASGTTGSLILWGPPGSGKTTVGRLVARATGRRFAAVSAVFSGVADLKKIFEEARAKAAGGERTLL